MPPEEDQERARGYDGWWEEVFGEHDDKSIEERRLRTLIHADHQTQKDIRDLRVRLGAAEQKIRRLRNATIALLGPVLMGGIVAFFYALGGADGLWSKLLVIGCGLFGIIWLRDVGNAFDDVTRD